MKLKRFINILLSRDHMFFVQFEKVSANVIAISKLLNELINSDNVERRLQLANEIDRLEDLGDKYTHEMYNEVSANFITPFDREDMHALISAIDDVVDYIHGSAKRITNYKDYQISIAMKKLVDLIQKGAQELHIAIVGLRHIDKIAPINQACAHIKTYENHADAVFYAEMSTLFEKNKDGVQVLKVMEILQTLETATDKCHSAAKVIEAILMKNS